MSREIPLQTRKLSELKATNPYLRLGTDVSELEKSIQTLGLIAPLVINTENVILAGARRYQALLNLGFTEAPVMVVDRNALEQELVSIDENLVRKDLSKIEIESHLRRAKEIYQALHPHEEVVPVESTDEDKVEILPAQRFLDMVAEKTGYSPKQIHQAIERDEKADDAVKLARKEGKLSLSQTNQIVKLKKAEQQKALSHLQSLGTKDIKKFVKTAQEKGVEVALVEVPHQPFAKELSEVESLVKRLSRKLIELAESDMSVMDFPAPLQKKIQALQTLLGDTQDLQDTDLSEVESLH